MRVVVAVACGISAGLLIWWSTAQAFPSLPAMLRNPDTDPQFNNVSLLIQPLNEDTSIIDRSKYGHVVTPSAGAVFSTTINDPFNRGVKVIDLNVNGEFLSVPDNNAFSFGSSDFTIEAWVYWTALGTGNNYAIFGHYTDNNNLLEFGVFNNILFQSNGLEFWISQGGSALVDTKEGADRTTPVNAWTHIALTRTGTTHRQFINGVLNKTVNSATNYTEPNFTGAFWVGKIQYTGSTAFLRGYLYSARVTNGFNRYTAAFTPPSAPFPIRGPQ